MYVDGFLLPVPKKKLAAYTKIATAASKIWVEHGALQYHECVADDMRAPMGVPLSKSAKTKPNETTIFAFIVYKSRAHRDAVNKKVMKDKRINEMCPDPKDMPFDCSRMGYGGFKCIVVNQASKKKKK